MAEKYRLIPSQISVNGSQEDAVRAFDTLTKNHGGVLQTFRAYYMTGIDVYFATTAKDNLIYIASERRKIKKDEVDFIVKKLTGWDDYQPRLFNADEILLENKKWDKAFKDVITVSCPIKEA